MRKLPVTKILTSLMVLMILTFSLAPAIAEAGSGDDTGVAGSTAVIHYQEGEGEEGGAEGGSLAGTGIALGLIGFVLLIVAVVAVIGAVSLGVIGLGYWQSESGD
jgi:hypothetical protein